MTATQREDLLIEWGIYNNVQQREIMREYVDLVAGGYSEESFRLFLREKLEIDGYWEKVGVV